MVQVYLQIIQGYGYPLGTEVTGGEQGYPTGGYRELFEG
jgi:hypothetical protein